MFVYVSMKSFEHRLALFERHGFGKKLHHAGIGVHCRKSVFVLGPPAPQQQTQGVEVGGQVSRLRPPPSQAKNGHKAPNACLLINTAFIQTSFTEAKGVVQAQSKIAKFPRKSLIS